MIAFSFKESTKLTRKRVKECFPFLNYMKFTEKTHNVPEYLTYGETLKGLKK